MAREDDQRRWREQMEGLDFEIVRSRVAQRIPVTDLVPYPDAAFVKAWLDDKQASAERREIARFETMRRWTVTAAIAGVVAAIAAIVAVWPVVFR